jgi:hypothetical protein
MQVHLSSEGVCDEASLDDAARASDNDLFQALVENVTDTILLIDAGGRSCSLLRGREASIDGET